MSLDGGEQKPPVLELDPGQNGVLNTAERVYDKACLAVIGWIAASLEKIDLETIDKSKDIPVDQTSKDEGKKVTIVSGGYHDRENTLINMRVMRLTKDKSGRLVNISDIITQSPRNNGDRTDSYKIERYSYPPGEDTKPLSLARVALTLLRVKAQQKTGLGPGPHRRQEYVLSKNS